MIRWFCSSCIFHAKYSYFFALLHFSLNCHGHSDYRIEILLRKNSYPNILFLSGRIKIVGVLMTKLPCLLQDEEKRLGEKSLLFYFLSM